MDDEKYRAKRMDNGKWVYGSLIKYNNPYVEGGVRAFIVPQNINLCTVKLTGNNRLEILAYCVVPSTVGRFTGLCDKNGKEIYKGDVITARFYSRAINDDYDFIGVVVWDKGAFGIEQIDCSGHIIAFGHADDKTGYQRKEKIIGSIHDNPELLKEAAP